MRLFAGGYVGQVRRRL